MNLYHDYQNRLAVRVINLDKRPDRFLKFKQIPLGFTNFSRFSAVDGSLESSFADVTQATKLRILTRKRHLHEELDSPGAWGASQSHFILWKQLINSPSDYMLVLEDDIDLTLFQAPGSLSAFIFNQLIHVPPDWDLFLLSGSIFHCSNWSLPLPRPLHSSYLSTDNCLSSESFIDVISFMGAQSYIITKQGAQLLLSRARPIEYHIDAYISLQSQLGHIRIIASNNPNDRLSVTDSSTDIDHTPLLTNSTSTTQCECNNNYLWIFLFFLLLLLVLILFIVKIDQ